ncbi:MAG: helix-turn-helix domain-containing protein [Lawsonibacter sp.]
MNAQKTGSLISACRKEKGLTQKQLAEQLHVSDRTVSKWERGAGFPDISLLEPLADALGISVTGLLQGERVPASESDTAVRNAVAVVYREMKNKAKKDLGRRAASVLLAVFVMGFFVLMLDYSGVFLKTVSMEIPVGVYVNGDFIEETSVSIHGKLRTFGHLSFVGQFAVAYVERTCRDGVTARISWGDGVEGYETIRYFAYGGSWDCGIESFLYSSEDMTRFALKLENGTVIATDAYDVPLMMLDEYYPLAW